MFEQFMQIMALACEKPEASDRPISTWTPRELADEAVKRGIVVQISPRTVERCLKGEHFAAPSQAVLAHSTPAELAEQICTICEVYEATPALAAQGTRVMSTNEMTGVQALERLHPCLPMLPGHVEGIAAPAVRPRRLAV